MTINQGILKIYFGHRRQLIPISLDDPHRLKRPLHKNWTERNYSPEEIVEYSNRGFNLGWRLGPGDVVIDYDPRNDPSGDGWRTLLRDFQHHNPEIEDLGDIFPAVKTGGGGLHFYGAIDPNIKIKNTVDRYGLGVEFKTVGRQVIIPGSMHPSGNPYVFDDFSDYSGPTTPLPEWLVSIVRREEKATTTPLPGVGDLSSEQLREMLAHIPADEYATNEEWFPLMAASHEATGGTGLEVFVEWSLTDPNFVGHDGVIRHRWQSFQPGKAGNIGPGTLFKEVVRHGGQLPPMTLANVPAEVLDDLPPVEDTGPVQPPGIVPTKTVDRHQLDRDVDALGLTSTADDIKGVLGDVARLDPLDQESYIQTIRANTGRQIGSLKKALAKARTANMVEADMDIDDMALEITTYLLQNKFQNGAHLVHGEDQRFWRFIETHWQPVEPNIIENFLLKASFQYRQQRPNIQTPLASLLSQSEKLLRARRAVKQNLNESLNGRPPVVNTKNVEVWMDPDTGRITTRPHSPDSWLTTCLDTAYNPGAKCTTFNKSLKQMFSKCPDRDDIIRHLWEVIGYIIQPQKDLATWVLLHGEGANGKTVVLNVLTALLGNAALNKSIKELDTERYNHALADLPNRLVVIDEDLDAKTILPDAVLKKVSESKILTANPKMRPSFDFLNTAIVLFASNEFPRIKDLSNGMRRRAHVFSFNRTFAEHEQDLGLSKRIIKYEMAGVLNEALKGFQRLRQRGGWDIPQSCLVARQTWLSKSNTISEFMNEMLTHTPGTQVELKQMFSIYRMWCMENGYTKQSTKPNFSKALMALGVPVERGTGNKVMVKDYTPMSTEWDLGLKGK